MPHRHLTYIAASVVVGLFAALSVTHVLLAAASPFSHVHRNLEVVGELAVLTAAFDQLYDADTGCVDKSRRVAIGGAVSNTGSHLSLAFFTGGLFDGDLVAWTTTFNTATRRASSSGTGRLIEDFSAEGAHQFSEDGGRTGANMSWMSQDGTAQSDGQDFGTLLFGWDFMEQIQYIGPNPHRAQGDGHLVITKDGDIAAHYQRSARLTLGDPAAGTDTTLSVILTPLTMGFCRLSATIVLEPDNSTFSGTGRVAHVTPR